MDPSLLSDLRSSSEDGQRIYKGQPTQRLIWYLIYFPKDQDKNSVAVLRATVLENIYIKNLPANPQCKMPLSVSFSRTQDLRLYIFIHEFLNSIGIIKNFVCN